MPLDPDGMQVAALADIGLLTVIIRESLESRLQAIQRALAAGASYPAVLRAMRERKD